MEIWKDIPNYEKVYQVSNIGNVRSLKFNKIKILKPSLDGWGYLGVILFLNKERKRFKIHKLVCMAFLKHKPDGFKEVVDHIDGNKINNNLKNLRLTTQRKNASRLRFKYTSGYVGVSWNKALKKWNSKITINKKLLHLGYFSNEYEAHLAYQKALKDLNNGLQNK